MNAISDLRRTAFTIVTAICMPLVVVGLFLITTVAAQAQDIAGRFTLIETQKGVFRIDTITGDVSRCEEDGGRWTCALLADERRAYEGRVAQLQDENRHLREMIENNGLAQRPQADTRGSMTLPSEEEVERALGLFERVMRGVFGIARDLERENESRHRL